MQNTNDELNLLLDNVIEIIWNRYENCVKDVDSEELQPGMYEFLGAQSIAYHNVLDDLREFKKHYRRSLPTENNHN